ncbi:MAG TPA: spore coat protein CotH [Ruminococcaceae bacterium]|nr:spore coat protein CotH [Oscillospiraceae bacterium]
MCGEKIGITSTARAMGYETKLFDTSKVHTINIVIDDWDSFLETCTDEEYTSCAVVIDNEAYKNVAIRAKGNTSLTQVKSYGNNRYSFKIEFDHYDSTKSYHGLDKLCLNNIIQDNTYMKDYLCYRMMSEFGVDSPLCSYVYITVNGEDWGLYLAVEGIEDSFLQRSYGNDVGELYKPDSQSMGGGRGNGGNFKMSEFNAEQDGQTDTADSTQSSTSGQPQGNLPSKPDGDSDNTQQTTDGQTNSTADSTQSTTSGQPQSNPPSKPDGEPGGNGGMGGGVNGSDDVSLIYSDDEYSSYQNIFDNAKTDISDSDKDRLIASLKKLNNNEDISDVVDVEEVIRYFVVHNFVCNFDSYTGSMIHNYYLYEKDGQMSMIPWDYNLAFGGFQGAQNASALVNYPIDTPVSGGTVDSRPMLAWIFASDEYTEEYHELFSEFIGKYFDSDYIPNLIESTKEMIAEYVEKDPTKFCTYEEFESGVTALKEFCTLRAESISGQLDGTIPSTSDGQTADSSSLIKADDLNISDMGTMNNNGGGSPDGKAQSNTAQTQSTADDSNTINDKSFSQTPPNNSEGSSDGTDNSTNSDSSVPTGGFGGTPPDMSDSNGSGPPSMPNGEMPSKPDGEMPSKPDGEMPSMPNGDTQDNSSEQNGDGQNEKTPPQNDETDGVTAQTLDRNSIIILAACASVLIIGVAAAFIYKKKS